MRIIKALKVLLALLVSLSVIMPAGVSAVEASNSSRLAISILASRAEGICQGPLNASLQLFAQNLMPYTPSTLFVFTLAKNVELMRACILGLFPTVNPHILVISIPDEDWTIPHHVRNETLWRNPIGWEYRMMGDWRLTHQMSFMRFNGYRFMLQADDDSYLLAPIIPNLITQFKEGGFQIGAVSLHTEKAAYVWGLAELTKYFVITEGFYPESLFDHCDPHDINGVYSRLDVEGGDMRKEDIVFLKSVGVPETGGWDFSYIAGNFLIIDMHFWFDPRVQRFVRLCRASGGSWNFRWNEQSVISMIWQLFVPNERLYMFPNKTSSAGEELKYFHNRHTNLSADVLMHIKSIA